MTVYQTDHVVGIWQPPIPGPVEVRVEFGSASPYVASVTRDATGTVLDTPRNRYVFAGLIPSWYSFIRSHPKWRRTVNPRAQGVPQPTVLPQDRQETLEASLHETAWDVGSEKTTAVFLVAIPEVTADSRILAVLEDGSERYDTHPRFRGSVMTATWWAKREEIREIRIVEPGEVIEVRFRVEEIPFYPPENREIHNLLDLKLPPLRFGKPDQISRYLSSVLIPQLKSQETPPLKQPSGELEEGMTVRGLLDRYYPMHWYVDKNRVHLGAAGFGGLAENVVTAIRGKGQ
jgi:hypothetical protein